MDYRFRLIPTKTTIFCLFVCPKKVQNKKKSRKKLENRLKSRSSHIIYIFVVKPKIFYCFWWRSQFGANLVPLCRTTQIGQTLNWHWLNLSKVFFFIIFFKMENLIRTKNIDKIYYEMSEIQFFQKFDFCDFNFLWKILINGKYLAKNLICGEKFDFWRKTPFLAKNSIFDKNLDFLS